MATTKTAKKAPANVKKAAKKTDVKVAAKRSSSASMNVKKTQNTTVSDLQKKVLDPKNRKSIYLSIAVIVLALAIFFGKSLVIAAMVNGEPISRLSIIHDLEAQSGKAALDAMITRTLVLQEAGKKNINVTVSEIDAEIAKIQKQFQAQGQNLDQLLATQGLSKDKFREEVKIQLIVTKILGSQAKVTDKEFSDFLTKNQDLIASEKDPVAAKANLRQQMEQQKLAQKYQEWIANLKKGAKVNYFVNY